MDLTTTDLVEQQLEDLTNHDVYIWRFLKMVDFHFTMTFNTIMV